MGESRELTSRHRSSLARRLAAVAAILCLTSATVALLPASSSAVTGQGGRTVAEGGRAARISRTEYGVPHIPAQDVDGLGYGYGYALAQDNGCELADHVVTLRGERSRFFGSDGEPGEGRGGRLQPRERHLLRRAAARGHRPPTALPRRAVTTSSACAAPTRA
ncbi:penicillin acylase family protein [Streptomyces sp. N50]|uniref:penicillin acylase family protein n=1 Tax=Streptomyces sp. N50 TaxID=3081765 RepID=UPI00398D2B42